MDTETHRKDRGNNKMNFFRALGIECEQDKLDAQYAGLRNERLYIRLTKIEKKIIERKAKRQFMSSSDYVRWKLLCESEKVELNFEDNLDVVEQMATLKGKTVEKYIKDIVLDDVNKFFKEV